MLQRHADAWKKEKDMVLPRKKKDYGGRFFGYPTNSGAKTGGGLAVNKSGDWYKLCQS